MVRAVVVFPASSSPSISRFRSHHGRHAESYPVPLPSATARCVSGCSFPGWLTPSRTRRAGRDRVPQDNRCEVRLRRNHTQRASSSAGLGRRSAVPRTPHPGFTRLGCILCDADSATGIKESAEHASAKRQHRSHRPPLRLASEPSARESRTVSARASIGRETDVGPAVTLHAVGCGRHIDSVH